MGAQFLPKRISRSTVASSCVSSCAMAAFPVNLSNMSGEEVCIGDAAPIMTFGDLHQMACDALATDARTLKLWCAERAFDVVADRNSTLEELGISEASRLQVFMEVLCTVSSPPVTCGALKLKDYVKHYHDRNYKIINVPDKYENIDIFQGACHHSPADRISIKGPADAVAYVLINSGNSSDEKHAFSQLMMANGWTNEGATSMWTDSFDRPDDYTVYSKQLNDGIKLAVNTHIELNIATRIGVSGERCSTSVSKSYPMMKFEEGVKQYTDRDYLLTDIPNNLIGGDFFQGPCHHNIGDEIIVSGLFDTTVNILVSDGNDSAEKAKMKELLDAWAHTTCSMQTGSFPVRGFSIYSKPLGESDMSLKLNTHIELSIVVT